MKCLTVLCSLVVFVLARLCCAEPIPHASTGEPFRVILISDTHLGFKKSNEAFQTFLKEVPTLPFKANYLINNGDIAEVGTREIFENYTQGIESIGLSPFNVIGNHDTRWTSNGKDLFVESIGPRYFSKDFEGIHWMFLDSTLEHQTQGHIDRSEIKWMKKDLESLPPNEPIFVFSHHPLKWRGMSVDDGLEVLNLLDHYPVAALFNGHGHKLEKINFRGIPLIENDALFNGRYLILEKSGDSVKLYVKTLDDPELKPWTDINLHPQPSGLRILESEQMALLKKKAIATDRIGWHDVRLVTAENPWGEDETRVFVPGKVLSVALGEIYAGLATNGRLVFGGTLDGTAFAVRSDGKVLWKRKLDDGILAAPFADGKIVYAATRGGTVFALRATNGTVLWKTGSAGPFAAPPAVARNTLFIGSGDKNLYALDAKTGKGRWRTPLGGFTEMAPLVDGNKVFVGAWDHTFYALDVRDGRILWKKNIGKNIYYSPSVARPVASHGMVYVTAKDHHLYALDEKTGKEKWKKDSKDTFSSPLLVQGKLILPEINGRVVALDPGTGKQLWDKSLPTSFYNASPLAENNRLFLVGVEGDYFELNLANQVLEDSFRVSWGWNFSTPVISGNKVWVGSLDGNLYAIPLK